MRSMLFVPGDSERKFAKATGAGADALILDLEDSVAPDAQARAAAHVSTITATPAAARDWSLWVRVNGWDTGLTAGDLDAAVGPGLDGVMLPKPGGLDDVVRLADAITALEAAHGLPTGRIRIAVVATETPAAVLNLPSYTDGHPRLAALTWGAEDLGAAIGATAARDADGRWTPVFQQVRAAALFAAHAAGALAIDTLHADFRDLDGLDRDSRASRRDGFHGRLAIHPDQVAVINAAYTPDAVEIAHAEKIVAAFAAHPGVGTLGVDGKMVDVPHKKAAERLLAAAKGGRALF